MSEIQRYSLEVSKETIERFHLQLNPNATHADGWVSLADYDALATRLAAAEQERDGWKRLTKQGEIDLRLSINTVGAYKQSLAAVEAQVKAADDLTGSFFEALKPLKLPAIDVQNPGRHVTDLITEATRLRDCLQSIAANTCCGPCREAALVAQAALAQQ